NDRNKRNKNIKKVPKRDPIYIDGQPPRPMYVDYKDLDLLTKLTNRHGRIVSRRKTGCHAASQHAVARAIKRARFMALLPFVGDCVVESRERSVQRQHVRSWTLEP